MPRYQKRHIGQSLTPRVSIAHDLNKTIADSLVKSEGEKEGLLPGMIWSQRDWCGQHTYALSQVSGRATFVWACNRSGGALSRGALTRWYKKAATATSGSRTTIGDTGAFIAGHEVGNHVILEDNNDSAGGAPEGEFGVIIKNTADLLTVQCPYAGEQFSVAVAVNDTYEIFSDCMVEASQIGTQDAEIAGIVMALSLANDYWGWICVEAWMVAALIEADSTVTKDRGLISHTGRLTVSNASLSDLILAYSWATIADPDTDTVPVRFRMPHVGQAITA